MLSNIRCGNNAIMNKLFFQTSHLTWSKIAMITCLTACLGDMLLVNIFSRYYPQFNPVVQPTSALGALGSPVAHVISACWILVGFIFLFFAYAFDHSEEIQTKSHHLTSWLFGLYAVGEEMGSGIFPGNRILGHLTTIGIVHNIIGGIGTGALLISPFVLLKKYQNKENYLMRSYLFFVGVSGILIFIVFAISHFNWPGMKWLYLRHGLIQRVFITDYYLFMMVVAVKLYYDKWKARMLLWFNPLQQP
jgi:hypothetical protein